MGMEQYKLKTNPVACKDAIIQGYQYRISVLTSGLIRFEYEENGEFEDRPTQSVINRNFNVPNYRVVQDGEIIRIFTEFLEITYNQKKFTSNGLSIKVNDQKGIGGTWYYGQEPEDLGGTARTLDMTNGDKVINKETFTKGNAFGIDQYTGYVNLGHGLVSRNGFSVIDDSRSMILLDNGWIEPRKEGIADFYFFGYGSRFTECLQDFYHLCGSTPLLPRYAFGNWWSRYHRYTESEYKSLITRFEQEELPFSVAVVDMDWHLVDDVDPKYGSGWTGYTWNRNFFPEPESFMDWLHQHNLKITLNVHPADGIRGFEEIYPRVAAAMGLDPASEIPVQFAPADPKFMEVYLKELHHPLEEQGVDFWWIDWQQGEVTSLAGLDPLWMLNHYHYLDSKWKGHRSMTFSRYAGIGSHRYPVGFSGDTVVSWESLNYQPYFTNTASNIGYGWWSHDIGGHMMGSRDDELMARWVQYGVFSPINRLHSTDNEFAGKEPWKFGRDTREVMNKYLRLRHALIPYLYTMNRRANRENLPLILPMYYGAPERFETCMVPNEYYFGTELIVSPITQPLDKESKTACVKTWLPEGKWADFFNGRIYQGERMIELYRNIDEIPVLMKAGAIVPLKDMTKYDNSTENPKAMEVRIFPAADGRFILWEDAGDTPEDTDSAWISTKMNFCAEHAKFTIEGAQGNVSVIPQHRTWTLVFAGMQNVPVCVTINRKEIPITPSWDEKTHFLTVHIPETAVTAEITVSFTSETYLAANNLDAYAYDFLEKAQIDYNQKPQIMNILKHDKAFSELYTMKLSPAVYGSLCELLDA